MIESEVDTFGSNKVRRLTEAEAAAWWLSNHQDRNWAATANRNLSFRKINRFLNDAPPTAILRTGYRLFLFKNGHDRDRFIDAFHRGYEAKAYGTTQD